MTIKASTTIAKYLFQISDKAILKKVITNILMEKLMNQLKTKVKVSYNYDPKYDNFIFTATLKIGEN